jgi:parvulin-like peptidyl-prolyl isomerase
LLANLRAAIWEDLAVGEITSEPVETVYGYHIIRKDDQRGEGDDTEIKASHILIRQSQNMIICRRLISG